LNWKEREKGRGEERERRERGRNVSILFFVSRFSRLK